MKEPHVVKIYFDDNHFDGKSPIMLLSNGEERRQIFIGSRTYWYTKEEYDELVKKKNR